MNLTMWRRRIALWLAPDLRPPAVLSTPAGPLQPVDWLWNPDNSGQGYVLDDYGRIYHFAVQVEGHGTP